MKITKLVLVTVAVITSLLLPVTGCEPMRTQTYDHTDFNRVEVGYAFRVEITRSDTYSISITAPENVFNVVQVSKVGETLKIGLAQPVPIMRVKAEITMPDLHALNLSGATKGTITGFSSSNDVDLDLSGASSLAGDIRAGNAVVRLSGASKAELEGSAEDININVSGASSINLSGFEVNNAQVLLSGASNGTVNLNGRLDADLSGASKLSYIGEPTMGDISTSGASTIRKK
ncbi:head GIN domain-containing protein [Chloroflexota bacterium]